MLADTYTTDHRSRMLKETKLDFIHLRTGEEKRKAATLKMADPALRYAAL
jgi:hypothetical protein